MEDCQVCDTFVCQCPVKEFDTPQTPEIGLSSDEVDNFIRKTAHYFDRSVLESIISQAEERGRRRGIEELGEIIGKDIRPEDGIYLDETIKNLIK